MTLHFDGLCDALLAVSMGHDTVGCVCHSLKINLNSNDRENANSVSLDKRVNESSSTTHPSAILDQSIYYYHLTPLFY